MHMLTRDVERAPEAGRMAAEGAPTGSGKAASNPFSWRLPKQIIALESFDFPHLHRRSDFNANKIGAIANPWMAGISTKRSPEQIRDMIRSGRFEPDDVGYLADLVMHFDCYYIRLFTMHCGISRYEMARAMIACNIRHYLLAEWMNCQSPLYEPANTHQRTWDLSSWL